MHCLIAVEEYYPIGGGIQQYVRGLARYLSQEGHTVTIVTRFLEGETTWEKRPEAQVIRTPLMVGVLPNPDLLLQRWQALTALLAEHEPDVIYTNNHVSPGVIRAARSLDIPVVYGCHGWGMFCSLKIRLLRPDNSLCYNERNFFNCLHCANQMRPAPRPNLYRHLTWQVRGLLQWPDVAQRVAQHENYQAWLNRADARIGVSQLVTALFGSVLTETVYCGIDPDEYAPSTAIDVRERYGINGDYVMVAGRIHTIKGQEWAVRALLQLPEDVQLVIVGNTNLFVGQAHEDNAHTRYLRSVIEELGLQDRIVWTGFLLRHDLLPLYTQALAVITPSVWLEAFGYVIAEAMACACPVVATANCGAAELITSGQEGYVVPRRDADAIAEAILKIRQQRLTMGQAARRTVLERLAWSQIGPQILAILERVRQR